MERDAALVAQRQQEAVATLQEVEQLRKELLELVKCPISHDTMEQPVLTVQHQTYERSGVEKWIQDRWEQEREMKGQVRDPCTGAPLPADQRVLVPDKVLQQFIQALKGLQGLPCNAPAGCSPAADDAHARGTVDNAPHEADKERQGDQQQGLPLQHTQQLRQLQPQLSEVLPAQQELQRNAEQACAKLRRLCDVLLTYSPEPVEVDSICSWHTRTWRATWLPADHTAPVPEQHVRIRNYRLRSVREALDTFVPPDVGVVDVELEPLGSPRALPGQQLGPAEERALPADHSGTMAEHLPLPAGVQPQPPDGMWEQLTVMWAF